MIPYYTAVAKKDKREKRRQAENTLISVTELPTLSPGDVVYVPDREGPRTVLNEAGPRSYLVQTPDGTIRRNRCHLIQTPQSDLGTENDTGTDAVGNQTNLADPSDSNNRHT